VRVAAYVVWLVAWLYLLVLVARMVIGLVMAFSRTWRPTGAAAAVAEVVYLLTDPPLKLVRKLIKPVRVGQMALDLGFMVVAMGVWLITYAAARVAEGGWM
jgi:YggT family protein